MPDMPCYPYVTKDHRTIVNDRELLDWIREKAGDDMATIRQAFENLKKQEKDPPE